MRVTVAQIQTVVMHLGYCGNCSLINTKHWKCGSFLTFVNIHIGTIVSCSYYQMICSNHVHWKI